ncbi:MAG: NADH-quinone oxidoreductase subunit J, partial [Parasporobacterium sp.]|nr:NADH-quinone oxidoreductase subunit J [Parasporobacterium sp.]
YVHADPVHPDAAMRRAPIQRVLARLNLGKYRDTKAPLNEDKVVVDRVKIPLRQHIGVPAVCAVKEGDTVHRGDVIGTPGKGLSVAIHASIDGTVTLANDQFVMIDARNG